MISGKEIFAIRTETEFNSRALEVFGHQYRENPVYRRFLESLNLDPEKIHHYTRIPFLPIGFFKMHRVVTGEGPDEKVFLSSGTTGTEKSRHYLTDVALYRESIRRGFSHFFGDAAQYDIFALMPAPEENPNSSLIFMVDEWIRNSGSAGSGFYLHEQAGLAKKLSEEGKNRRKKILIGLTYALLDFTERFPLSFAGGIVMETGGMKGRREEMVREELHRLLKQHFLVSQIHSEYGMTELLSQAISEGEGVFRSPPWMKILIRDPDDPLELIPPGRTGGVNIIDLANIHSCSFIATQDLGKLHPDGSFEILGRFDDSDLRGCSLMV